MSWLGGGGRNACKIRWSVQWIHRCYSPYGKSLGHYISGSRSKCRQFYSTAPWYRMPSDPSVQIGPQLLRGIRWDLGWRRSRAREYILSIHDQMDIYIYIYLVMSYQKHPKMSYKRSSRWAVHLFHLSYWWFFIWWVAAPRCMHPTTPLHY